jgi:hypothetical protein
MTDIATDLRAWFDWAMYLCLEAYTVLPDGKLYVRSDEDELAIGIFKNLRDSLAAIPKSLITTTEEIHTAAPELFQKMSLQRMRTVGLEFSPTSATEFVEVLNRTVAGRMNLDFIRAEIDQMRR